MSMTFFLPVFPSQRNELAKKKRISLWVLLTGHVRMTNRNQEKQKLKKHKKKKKRAAATTAAAAAAPAATRRKEQLPLQHKLLYALPLNVSGGVFLPVVSDKLMLPLPHSRYLINVI